MRGWDNSHIERLKFRGMVVDHSGIANKNIPKKVIKNIPTKEPAPLREMKQILKYMQIDFVTEHKFLPDRKFRFDIALPDKMIAIEFEGLFSNKSRHTTVTGYSGDTEKYNLAVIAGWRLLRYTQLTYKNFLSQLNKIM